MEWGCSVGRERGKGERERGARSENKREGGDGRALEVEWREGEEMETRDWK